MADSKLGAGNVHDELGASSGVRKEVPKRGGEMSHRHKKQHGGPHPGQIWDSLSIRINTQKCSNLQSKINIHESTLVNK